MVSLRRSSVSTIPPVWCVRTNPDEKGPPPGLLLAGCSFRPMPAEPTPSRLRALEQLLEGPLLASLKLLPAPAWIADADGVVRRYALYALDGPRLARAGDGDGPGGARR